METEPWMRGTHEKLDPVIRGVVHALELAQEDADRWCACLTDGEMFARPAGLPPVAFHLRHVARSLDRLLTYAEDRSDLTGVRFETAKVSVLSEAQSAALQSEMGEDGSADSVLAEFRAGLESAHQRVQGFAPETFAAVRGIGRKRLPTTIAGLLVHCAEHTARHIGQMVTTVKIVKEFARTG